MLIKKKYSGELQHLLSRIKKTVDQKRNILVFKSTSDHSIFLNKLVLAGIIKSFIKSQSIFVIHLRGCKHSSIRWFNKSSKSTLLKYGNIKHRIIRDGGVPLFLINTDKGLLSQIEASKSHIGGKPLLFII